MYFLVRFVLLPFSKGLRIKLRKKFRRNRLTRKGRGKNKNLCDGLIFESIFNGKSQAMWF